MTLHIAHSRSLEKYQSALRDFPAPGQGRRHGYLLTCANLGAVAGVPADQLTDEILTHVPQGGRPITRREVADTVTTAYRERVEGQTPARTQKPRPQGTRPDTGRFWRRVLDAWPEESEPLVELWERSPVRLDWESEEDTAHLLDALYLADEYVFIGGSKECGIPGQNLRTVTDWLAFFQSGGTPGPHIIPNPLTGQQARTKADKPSFRCDAAVSYHRYIIVEFDGLPKWKQAAFWLYAPVPVVVILDSGGKSLHGWVRVDCPNVATWNTEVRPFFDNMLAPLGADRQCKNPARMSRTPGVKRGSDWQRILYLDPAGRVAA